jgi:cell division protease FtsH
MVMQYGMSERIGAIRLGQPDGEVFLGRDMGHGRDFSEGVAEAVDEEVRKLIESAHQEAYDILLENRDVLDQLVVELLDRETLDREEVEQIFANLRKHSMRPVWLSSSERPVSPDGPVLSRKELAARDEPSPNGSNGQVDASAEPSPTPVDSEQE